MTSSYEPSSVLDFRALFGAAPTPMLVIAPDAPRFTIVAVNDAYLVATMRTHDDLVGSALFEAMPDNPDDPGATGVGNLRASIERAIADGRADRMALQKYDILHPDGGFEERWWDPVNTPVIDAAGTTVAVIHQVVDATERVRAKVALDASQQQLGVLNEQLEQRVAERTEGLMRAEEALRQSQKMEAVGQLTGGVAHDFNNLLTVIRGSVEMLRRPDLPEERRDRYLSAVGDTAERATALTQQLLAFARRQALRPEAFDVGGSLKAVTSLVRTLIGSRVELEVATPAEPLFALGDRGQFDTAIVNMAANARDAMDGAGRLRISAGAVSEIPELRSHPPIAGDFVAITVTDSGSGIPLDRLERIFEPFFTTKAPGAGTGLGLSQVFGFAKQSEGDLAVESPPGQGATFTLYMPRTAAVEEEEAEPPPEVVDGAGVCVLLVEDNQEVREFAADALATLGYACIVAPDGASALRELEARRDRVNVVFSDVVMPGMSGVELGEHLRRSHPDIPVILASGYSHVLAENGRHGFELLHKPYSIQQLSRVIRKALTWQAGKRGAP